MPDIFSALRTATGCACAAVLAPVGAATAQAPAAATPATGSQEPESNLQDIIVTAQSRPERLQDVPISAAVATGESLRAANVTSVQTLTQAVPGVTVVSGGRTDRLFVRGVGSGGNPSLEQSVSLFVDGIYHGRSRSSRASFLDVERVEVLKGPQTTYFGNNSIAGAVSVISRGPGDRWSMDARTAYGSDDEYALEVGAGGPIGGGFSIRVAGLVSGFDGYTANLADGGRLGGQRNRAARGTIRWAPSDLFDISVKAEVGEDARPGGLPIQIINCPPAAPFPGARGFCAAALAAGQETRLDDRATLTPGSGSRLNTQEYVVTGGLHLDGADATSITGWSKFRYALNLDLDELAPPLFGVFTDERYRQFTQELRLATDAARPLSTVIGAYYLDYRNGNDTEFSYPFLSGNIRAAPPFAALIPFLPLGQSLVFAETGETYSAYGSLTVRLGDRLRITGGGRWTKADKRLTQAAFFGSGAPVFGRVTPLTPQLTALANAFGAAARLGFAGVRPFSRSDEKFTPSANIQFDAARGIMLYASYAKGFKAGGFNGADTTGNVANFPFQPETVDAYEIGAKTRFGDVLFNIAAFLSDYHDRQVSVSQLTGNGTVINVVRNAAESRSKGIEAEFRWAPVRALTLGLTGTYLDSRYRKYANAGPTALQTLNGRLTQDLSGQRTEFAPRFSGRFDIGVSQPLGDVLKLRADGALFRTSSYSIITSNDPNLRQPGYWRVDGSVGLGAVGGGWELSVIGRNLTDRKIFIFGNDLATSAGSYSVALDRGRSVVAQLSFRF